MARLDQAAERLQEALARLETAIGERQADGAPGSGSGGGPGDAGGDAGANGAEVAAALAAAKRENADLQRIAGEVSDRLDRTVDRLKGLLAD